MCDIAQHQRTRTIARALQRRWQIDPRETNPPHAWNRCTCAHDELRALACSCRCHGTKPSACAPRRYRPGMPYARITDITTRQTRTPGELNRERRARLKLQKQPRLFK